MSAPVHTPGALGSSPLTAALSDAGGNQLFAATPRRATDPADELGTLEYLNRKRDSVGHVAIEYRAELAAAINPTPQNVDRWHLESLLYFIDRAIEAEAAFRAACQAADEQYRLCQAVGR